MSTPSSIKDVMRDLFLGGQFSDMEIICQDVTFKMHRAIVCTQSSYFGKAFCNGFKESIDRSISLQDDTPETIERVLSFLYLKEYCENGHIFQFQPNTNSGPAKPDATTPENQTDVTETLKTIALNHIRVFVAADKFGIDPLKYLATTEFSNWATTNWNSSTFPEVVEEVMVSVPSHELDLQEVIARVLSAHIFDLAQNPAMLDILNSFGSLGSLTITELIHKKQIRKPYETTVLDSLAQKLNSNSHCRHCSISLNVEMKNAEYQIGMFRCAVCHTRH